jgi:hypothetical protein
MTAPAAEVEGLAHALATVVKSAGPAVAEGAR